MKQARKKGIEETVRAVVEALNDKVDKIYMTVDMDVLDVSVAPGAPVSTPGGSGMGGGQTLAVTMNEGVVIAIEVDETRIDRRIETRYCDVNVKTLDEALERAVQAKEKGQPLSIGLLGNAAEILPEMVRRTFIPDVLTDQTSAHDPLNGYIPIGIFIPCDYGSASRRYAWSSAVGIGTSDSRFEFRHFTW